MIIKAFDVQNKEIATVQQDPAYVKYNLQYETESGNFKGFFEIVRGEANMLSLLKVLKYSVQKNLSHLIVENEDGTQLYGVSMLFAEAQTINIHEGHLYFRMGIIITPENMEEYAQFLEAHGLYQ